MSTTVRHDYKLSAKQYEIYKELFTPHSGIKQLDLCCGRGFGKTYLSIVIAVIALLRKPRQVGLFMEPSWSDIDKTFWMQWRDVVDGNYKYKVNKKECKITMENGSVLFYSGRNVTSNIEAQRNKNRGPNYNFVLSDEEAIGCDHQQYNNTLGAIRAPGDCNFYCTLSTPKVGAYKRLITSPEHSLHRGISSDNPFLPDYFIPNLIKNMSRDEVRREIYAEFVSFEGRLWKTAKYDTDPKNKDVAWPNGNRHDQFRSYRPNQPWWLLCDLGGATGAYVVVQETSAAHKGRILFPGPVWVAVADFCPINDASAARAFAVMDMHYGCPQGVVAGADIGTRSTTDGLTVSYFVQRQWGNVQIYPCNEARFNKQLQYDTLNYLMCTSNDERRFTIARDFVALEPDSARGVREMIDEDAWPDEAKRRPGDVLPKNKEIMVQHVRDALLMGAVKVMVTPEWIQQKTLAA